MTTETAREVQIDKMQTPNQQIRYVPMELSERANYSHTGKVYTGLVELRGMNRYQGHTCNMSIYYHDADHEARREYQGPIVKGEHTYLIPQATIISNPPHVPNASIQVKQGDLLLICGNLYEYQEGSRSKDSYLIKVEV